MKNLIWYHININTIHEVKYIVSINNNAQQAFYGDMFVKIAQFKPKTTTEN